MLRIKNGERYPNNLEKTIELSERIFPGWVVFAKRWVVERTFACLNPFFGRCSKDYPIAAVLGKNSLIVAHSMVLLRRLIT